MVNKWNKLKEAFKEAADYEQIQMGFVFGVVIFMIFSLFLHSILGKLAAALTIIMLEYLGRVHKWYLKI